MKAENLLPFPNLSVPEPCDESQDGLNEEQEFVSVTEIARLFSISKSLVYELIRHEPNFPVINLGRKKKFVIHLKGFCEWFKNRQIRMDADVPTGFDLLRRHKK